MRGVGAESTTRTGETPPVFICLLGSFRLLRDGQLVSLRPGGKLEAFLSTLVLRRASRVPREMLLETLWPDTDFNLAVQSLNSLVYSLSKMLSKTLGGAAPILHPDGSYRLNFNAGIGVDIVSFDELAYAGAEHYRVGRTEAAASAYERAIWLYVGDLYAATDAHGVVERERLRALYHTALARLAERHFNEADYATALDLSLQLLASDPTREDAYRMAMRCYVRRGERAQALRQYKMCERILRAEFDADPEPATLALFERVRRNPSSI